MGLEKTENELKKIIEDKLIEAIIYDHKVLFKNQLDVKRNFKSEMDCIIQTLYSWINLMDKIKIIKIKKKIELASKAFCKLVKNSDNTVYRL